MVNNISRNNVPKKILLINMVPGSMEGIIYGISKYLFQKKRSLFLLNYTNYPHFHRYAKVINVNWTIPSGKIVGAAISRKLMIFDILLRLILLSYKEKIDIIHCFFTFPAGVSATIFKLFNRKTKVIITVAGDDVEFIAPLKYGLRLHALENHLIRYCLKNADRVIAPSSYSARLSLIAGSISNKTVLIPFGIDLTRIDELVDQNKFDSLRSKYNLDNNKVLVTLCRLHKKKGLSFLLEGFYNILKDFENIRLVIIGEGDERKFLEKIVSELDLMDSVIFTGYISTQEKYNLLSLSDVFILPSISDTFPIAVLEAMGCSLPVIITDHVGVSDYIYDNDCGYIISTHSSNQISKYVLTLLQNNDLLKMQSQNARQLAMKLNYDNIGRKIMAQYRNV